MNDIKSKSCLICDWGLFAELAPRLAREYGKVWYFTPWANSYPKAAGAYIGHGLEGVERIDTFWDYVPQADVVVFPDIYFAKEQLVVAEKFGKPVWGHRNAEMLELDRRGTRRLQRTLDIPAPKTRFFTGVDDLAKYLETVEDKWVKISCFRGDGETWHHETWHTTAIYLDHFRNRVGALADEYEFVVEDHVEGIEVGFDGWQVHGQWPSACFWGFEVKDKGYIGQFSPYDNIPEPVRTINTKIAPILRYEQAVGFCSFEFRFNGDGKPYMIDPCLRCGSPPTEGTMEGYDNLGEIIWEGAHGNMCEAIHYGKYLAMAMIHSPFALTNWVPIEVPEPVRRWVKLRNAVVLGGKLYHAPVGGEMVEIGAVVGLGDTLQQAIDLVKHRAEQVRGYNLEIHVEALDDAQEEIEKAAMYGIVF